MSREQTMPNGQEQRSPGPFTRFLWWLATAEKELLAGCITDGNRFSIIGMTVLATWLFATAAWTYFFSTVTGSMPMALCCGLFMGFIVLTIDRALIKGITRSSKNRALPLLFRSLLALTIGFFMAQPALLYIFDKEIRMQTSLDNEKRRQDKRAALDTLYSNRKAELLAQLQSTENADAAAATAVDKARQAYLAETDGSGGTGKVGIKDVALAKRSEYQKLDAAYQEQLTSSRSRKDSLRSELAAIETSIKKDEMLFAQTLEAGFLTRTEALANLLKKNNALQLRYYLIVCMLLLIELMPVIAKSMLATPIYDEKAALREAMEKETARSNTSREQELKELCNQLAHESDRQAIAAFFAITGKDREARMQELSAQWKQDSQQPFDSLWQKMKSGILTRQEA